ncbi:MAG: ABC transporter substrate-binding protein [Acidobacteriota bacterium]|nr:ABC transporter substrate-binding protein [Blastocatellia bacterium]MDW8411571.1 ABC transporter substrate-binding protein [Acidobacteriota bacterium]
MKIGLVGTPATFNPFLVPNPETYEITSKLFATLLDYNYAGQKFNAPADGLARSIDALPDGKTFVIHLREAAFSNGIPITADDVIFSYQMAIDERNESVYGDLLRIGPEKAPPKFIREDQYTLRVSFPVRYELVNFIFARVPIVSKGALQEVAEKGNFREAYGLETPPEKLVCSGPFVLKSYTPDKQIELAYNPHYWKVDSSGTSLPYVDSVIYFLKTPSEGQSEGFAKKEFHIATLLPKKFKELKDNDTLDIRDLGVSLSTWGLVLNWRADPKKIDPYKATWFRTPGFKWSLLHAVDRDAIIKEVFDGMAQPALNIISPSNTTWYNPDFKKYEYNLEKARETLIKVRYSYSETGALKDISGKTVKFTITHLNDTIPTKIAERLAQDFRKIGMQVDTDPKDYKTFWKVASTGLYDTLLIKTSPMFPDPAFLQPYMTKRGKYFWFYEPAAVGARLVGGAEGWMDGITAKMEEASQKVLLAERRELYNEAQVTWADKAPIIYLVSENVLVGAQKNIGNFKPSVLEPSLTWNIEELFFK